MGIHEFGHQFSAGHTWNNCPGNEGQYASGSAWEPGSGATFLSYKGSCGSSNLPGSDILYYHNGTIGQIWNFTRNGGGSICGNTIETTNHAPEIEWPYTNGFYIPISTPFELEAKATDADGNPLVYSWEQMNLGPSMPLGSQAGTSPSFRTYNPATSPKRTFPRLPILLSNGSENTELLPTYTRNLAFRFLVRDNNTNEGAGGVTWEDVSFEATATAGPFLVTYPNTQDVIWKGGQQVEVTWDVANTDNSLVNCKAVNIKLSVDGGQTYPYTLASFTPNDGSETVFVPGITTNTARLRVEASENIFFDISNENFVIEPADIPGFTFFAGPQAQQVCVPQVTSVQVNTGSVLGFDVPIELDVTGGLPAGASFAFSSNSVVPGQSSTLTLNMNNVTASGLFEVVIRAIAGEDTSYTLLFLDLVYNDFSDFSLLTPADGASGETLAPLFTWADLPQAKLYDFQLATSPSFEPDVIVGQAFNLSTQSFMPTVALQENSIYFWRVRPFNECGKGDFSSIRAFQTRTVTCETFPSIDVPKPIPNVGLPTVQSKLAVLQPGVISDLKVSKLRGTHDALPDIEVKLISPIGTEVLLFSAICGNVSQFNLGLSDQSPIAIQCPPINGSTYKPQEPLAKFIGENTVGEWTLQTKVISTLGNGGSIQEWALQFCASISPKSPYIVKNDTIYVKPLDTRLIHNFELAAEHEDIPGTQLVFTVLDNTGKGYLSLAGVPLSSGDQFTMTDIHEQRLTYTNTDGDAEHDAFSFIVTASNNGWTGTHRFHIVIDENAITFVSDKQPANHFNLFPNPATDRITVMFDRPLGDLTIMEMTDVNGRRVMQQKMEQGLQQATFNVMGLTPGVYFLTVRNSSGILAKKLVVQR